MRIIDAEGLQKRILEAAESMDCKNLELDKQGMASPDVNKAIFELMFIHQFLPFMDNSQVRQKECYLNEKYGV